MLKENTSLENKNKEILDLLTYYLTYKKSINELRINPKALSNALESINASPVFQGIWSLASNTLLERKAAKNKFLLETEIDYLKNKGILKTKEGLLTELVIDIPEDEYNKNLEIINSNKIKGFNIETASIFNEYQEALRKSKAIPSMLYKTSKDRTKDIKNMTEFLYMFSEIIKAKEPNNAEPIIDIDNLMATMGIYKGLEEKDINNWITSYLTAKFRTNIKENSYLNGDNKDNEISRNATMFLKSSYWQRVTDYKYAFIISKKESFSEGIGGLNLDTISDTSLSSLMEILEDYRITEKQSKKVKYTIDMPNIKRN